MAKATTEFTGVRSGAESPLDPARNALARSECRYERQGIFSGWCREGYWEEGILFHGKRGREVTFKFSTRNPQDGCKQPLAVLGRIESVDGPAFVLDVQNKLYDNAILISLQPRPDWAKSITWSSS